MNIDAPLIFQMTDNKDRSAFEDFVLIQKKEGRPLSLIDTGLAEEFREKALLSDPSALFSGKDLKIEPRDDRYVWVVYPWRNIAVRTLDKDAFRAVRLSRNKNLITDDEAYLLASSVIGYAGLNVGNPAAICLAQEGVGKHYRMADNDVLSLSNMNRFRAGLPDLGVNKATLTARQVYEIDPYVECEVWDEGITVARMGEFLSGIDILIEEMDHMPLKIAIREEARRKRIPVIMVTGNGHDIILDVERFDKEPDLPLLSGKLDQDVVDALKVTPLPFEKKVALARDFIGTAYLCDRLNSSFSEVGKTLIGIPQIAEASFLRGAALAHTARKILLGEEVKSGRYGFGLGDLYSQPL